MNARTLKALKGSILKWEKIASGEGVDKGTSNCPLCAMFYEYGTKNPCRGCPVEERTRRDGCDDTPYTDWVDATNDTPGPHRKATTKRHKAIALREVKFLKSLFP